MKYRDEIAGKVNNVLALAKVLIIVSDFTQ